MFDPVPRYEVGDTRQFTVAYSGTPSTPLLTIRLSNGVGGAALVASQTAQSSGGGSFYSFWTMPGSRGLYYLEWVASFTAGPVVDRDVFRVVQTYPGT